MATLLARNAALLATFGPENTEINNGGLFIRDGVIEALGPTEDLPETADRVINLSGHVVLPGLINTHHHLYQTLTRVIPAAQDALLFDWLKALYPLWGRLTPSAVKTATQTGIAELLLSGCTATSDHLYLFPNGVRLDDTIEAALETGIRFHATRGSMSIGESKGGLPPDFLVEEETDILRDCQRVVESFHDASDYAHIQVALAPCSPFSVSRDLMRETAVMARSYGVRLHTHLAENAQDIIYSEENFGQRPGDYAEALGWVGDDVWHAHCVQLDESEIQLFARTGTAIAHCPCSNMRLGSGIAPLRRMLDAGVPVGLGVDGSASNDGADLLGEARQAMLLQRVREGAAGLSAREALKVATAGGARALGRRDLGYLAPGMAGDFAAFSTESTAMAGAGSDPLAALVFCGPHRASYTVIGGRVVVDQGEITSLHLPNLLQKHRAAAADLLRDEAR
ncbi:8-oxoguanine deaminase [Pelagibius sp. Alg239-R121]|uniref:8-oxoguanine deaminase n=1 Tax=Pelagibius sp. Alg239-R121 TaxID=2993448 RepID=UPI0024A669F1|nr:8-oxoguanine deaminase [Pelagibius sp. Alg239-R121]